MMSTRPAVVPHASDRRRLRTAGIGLVLVASSLLPLALPREWAPWLVMWLTATAVFASCKALTWFDAGTSDVATWRRVAYLVAWPGLDAPAFLSRPARDPPGATEWLAASAKLLTGVAVLWWLVPRLDNLPDAARAWVGMAGVVLVLHFGSFHLLSCLWRRCGLDAPPLMDRPLASVSVAEFWGRRWNRAFRDLSHRFLFRPLTKRFGPRAGLFAGFLFSGLVHDAVISLPAGGGYGLPTAYFVLQAAGLLVERGRLGRRAGLGRGIRGRLFTAAVVAGPAPLLFHPPFLARVVVPFLRFLGAW